MKSIIASLFTIYALTNGSQRLLQQAAPVTLPGNAATTSAAPAAWVPPELPSLNNPSYQTVMECVLPNTDPAGCAGRVTSIQNPANNMVLTCSAMGACAAATLNFTYVNSMAERVEQVSFSEAFAGYNAKIIMDSTQSLQKQYIDKLEFKAQGAGQGVTVQLIGGASVNDCDCARPEYCPNCFIETCEWLPNVVPRELLCDPNPKPCFRY